MPKHSVRSDAFNNAGQTPYAHICQLMSYKDAGTIANNTYASAGTLREDGPQLVSVVLHATEIMRAYADGATVLRTNGYRTVTTKQRLNALLPNRVRISSVDHEWRVFFAAVDAVTGAWSWTDVGPFVELMVLDLSNPYAPKKV